MQQIFELDSILDSIMPNQINLKSFETKQMLNPKIWHNGILDIKVQHTLINIAKEFKKFLKIDWVKPIDAIIVGSMASYNWSKYSDIDLHLLYDFSKIDNNVDFVKNYFTAKKTQWNSQHEDLKIFGYNVELYVQDINEENASEGIYSLKNNVWIKIPTCKDLLLNRQLIKIQASQLINIIDNCVSKKDSGKLSYDNINNLYLQIINGRKQGLAANGEGAVENIVFKVLRRTGHLKKLIDLKNYLYDKIYSLDESYNFDLDNDIEDVSISDTIYPTKQKINKDSLNITKQRSLQTYYETHPRIKVGDILYDNFIRNDNEELVSLGYKDGENEIGICCIQPDFLPDKEARFIAYDEFNSVWGYYEGIKKLPYIDNILTIDGLISVKDSKYFYSDKFPKEYYELSEYNLSNPYIDVNKFNKEWLTPNQVLFELQGWKNQEIILKEQGLSGEFVCQKCYNYSTKNTIKGEWYLPTASELAIMLAKFNTLNKAGSALSSSSIYWSSTQYSSEHACSINTKYCYIDGSYKFNDNQVRPFFHIALANDFYNEQLNESMNFDLDSGIEDVSISDTIYPTKQRINKDSLNKDALKARQHYYNNDFLRIIDIIKSHATLYSKQLPFDDKDKELFNDCIEADCSHIVYTKDELRTLISGSIKLFDNQCNLNWINTINISDFSHLFNNSKFNGDISNWNTINATDMSGMFKNSEFNGDISNWNTGGVKNMSNMFDKSKFNQPLNNWDVSRVENMEGMFQNNKAFNQPLYLWNVSNVKNMSWMFFNSNFKQDISKWNSKPQISRFMFEYCPIKENFKCKV